MADSVLSALSKLDINPTARYFDLKDRYMDNPGDVSPEDVEFLMKEMENQEGVPYHLAKQRIQSWEPSWWQEWAQCPESSYDGDYRNPCIEGYGNISRGK